MKPLNTILLLFSCLMVVSCNKEAPVEPESKPKTSEVTVSNAEIITTDMLPYISQHDQIALGTDLTNEIIRSLDTPNTPRTRIEAQQDVIGPFTEPGIYIN